MVEDEKSKVDIEKIKENICILTTEIKEEIRKFSNDIKTVEDSIKELHVLSNKIKEIKQRLVQIENNPKKQINNIIGILRKIKNIEEEMQIDSIGRIFKAIDDNLPDGIELSNVGCDNRCRKIKSGKNIMGRIIAIGEEGLDFRIKVEIDGFVATTKEIDKIGKIYTIVNFINDRLNYKNDEITIEKKHNSNSCQ